MNNLTKKLESYTNIAIIALVLMVGAVLVKTYLLPAPAKLLLRICAVRRSFSGTLIGGKTGRRFYSCSRRGAAFAQRARRFISVWGVRRRPATLN